MNVITDDHNERRRATPPPRRRKRNERIDQSIADIVFATGQILFDMPDAFTCCNQCGIVLDDGRCVMCPNGGNEMTDGETFYLPDGWRVRFGNKVARAVWHEKGPAEAQLSLLRSGYSVLRPDGHIVHKPEAK